MAYLCWAKIARKITINKSNSKRSLLAIPAVAEMMNSGGPHVIYDDQGWSKMIRLKGLVSEGFQILEDD